MSANLTLKFKLAENSEPLFLSAQLGAQLGAQLLERPGILPNPTVSFRLNRAISHHRIGHFNKAGDVGTLDVIG